LLGTVRTRWVVAVVLRVLMGQSPQVGLVGGVGCWRCGWVGRIELLGQSARAGLLRWCCGSWWDSPRRLVLWVGWLRKSGWVGRI